MTFRSYGFRSRRHLKNQQNCQLEQPVLPNLEDSDGE